MSIGNLVILDQTTVSAVSSYAITGLITRAYDDYVIRYNVNPSTSGANLVLQTTNTNASLINSGYVYAYRYMNSVGIASVIGINTSGTGWILTRGMNSTSTSSSVGEVKLFNLLNTLEYPVCKWETSEIITSTSYIQNQKGGGRLVSLDSMSALLLSASTGTITGTFTFLGVEI